MKNVFKAWGNKGERRRAKDGKQTEGLIAWFSIFDVYNSHAIDTEASDIKFVFDILASGRTVIHAGLKFKPTSKSTFTIVDMRRDRNE